MIKQVATVISLLSVAGAASAQTASPDPWKRVPALPTSCYRDAAFGATVNDAQEKNNGAVREYLGKIDHSYVMRRHKLTKELDPK